MNTTLCYKYFVCCPFALKDLAGIRITINSDDCDNLDNGIMFYRE